MGEDQTKLIAQIEAELGQSWKDIPAQIKKQLGGMGIGNNDPLGTVSKGAVKTEKDIKSLGMGFNGFIKNLAAGQGFATSFWGAFGGAAAAVIALQLAQQAIRAISQYIKEAITNAYNFERAMFILNASIGAINRGGIAMSFKDINTEMQSVRDTYKIFSNVDVVQGTTTIIVKMRQLNGTLEETKSLMESIGKIAIMAGTSYSEAATDVSVAISTGYSRTLQKLGVAFSPALLNVEAMAEGFNKSYRNLTLAQRTMVATNLIEKQMASYAGELSNYWASQPGQIDAATALLTDYKTQVGEALLPIEVFLEKLKVEFWGDISMLIFGDPKNTTALKTYQNMLAERGASYEEYIKGMQTATNLLAKADPAGFGFGNIPAPISEKDWQKLVDDARAAGVKAKKALIAGFSAEESNAINEVVGAMKSEIEDGLLQLGFDIEKINATYTKDVLTLNTKLTNDLNTDAYNRDKDLLSIDQNYYDDAQKAQEKYNQSLLDNETDLQRNLKDLKDKALFDLDESVRKGDARQTLSILRQYKFDAAKAKETASYKTTNLSANYTQEQADLKQSYNEKRKLAWDDYYQRVADTKAQWQADKNALDQKKIDDIQQLRDDLQAKLDQKAAALIREGNLTDAEAKMAGQLTDELGRQYNLRLNAANEYYKEMAWMQANGAMSASTIGFKNYMINHGLSADPRTLYPGLSGFANGGSFIATRPTAAIFGEGTSPELVTATPLHGGTGNGNLQIDILLSPDLEARVVNHSLSELSNVLTTVRRASK